MALIIHFYFGGGWNFILLVFEKYIVKPEDRFHLLGRIFWRIITLLSVNFGWVMFYSSDWRSGIRYCLGMLGRYGASFSMDTDMIHYLREFGFFLAVGILFSTPIVNWIKEKMRMTLNPQKDILALAVVLFGYGFLFLWAVSYLILGSHNPFLYFNF